MKYNVSTSELLPGRGGGFKQKARENFSSLDSHTAIYSPYPFHMEHMQPIPRDSDDDGVTTAGVP